MNSQLLKVFAIGVTAAFIVLLLSVMNFPLGGEGHDGIWRFFGRFHPLILHFPVVLLPLALALEASRFVRPIKSWPQFAFPVLVMASLSAVFTVILGVMLASGEGHVGELVQSHRSRGVSVAVLALVALALRLVSQTPVAKEKFSKVLRGVYGIVLGLACLYMGLAAHDGGSMVHGPEYLSQFAPSVLKPFLEPKNQQSKDRSFQDVDASEKVSAESRELAQIYVSGPSAVTQRYCSKCHGAGKQKAGIRFDELDPAMGSDHDVEHWRGVRDALNSYQMPPKEAAQPSEDERLELVRWIDKALKAAGKTRRSQRSSPLRRLSVAEYDSTLRQLFDTTASFVDALPPPPVSQHGYTTDAGLLNVSPLDLEFFLQIARDAVNRYVVFEENTAALETFSIEFENHIHFTRGRQDKAQPLSPTELSKVRSARLGSLQYQDRGLTPIPFGPTPFKNGNFRDVSVQLNNQLVNLESIQPHNTGELVIRMKVAAEIGSDGSAPRLELRVGGKPSGAVVNVHILGQCDVTAPLVTGQVCEFRAALEDVPVIFSKDGRTHVSVYIYNAARHKDAVFYWAPEGDQDPQNGEDERVKYEESALKAAQHTKDMLDAGVNRLFLDWMEVEIQPYNQLGKIPKWIVDIEKASQSEDVEKDVARDILVPFMEAAYRRSVAAIEIEQMLVLFDSLRNKELGFQRALRETLAAVLISDQFLHVAAPLPLAALENEQISDNESNKLAERISYFLWQGPPDERLRELAKSNKLNDASVRAKEVARLLEDRRSKEFTSAFAAQWLRFDKLDLVTTNPEYYPDYDDSLGNDFKAESIATFQHVFENKLDARELLNSDTAYINQRLAYHYGLDVKVTGGRMRPIKLPESAPRGGLLTQGAILKLTSDGAESNPIFRGVWVLERLLNDPPPPPPPVVPDLEETSGDLNGLSLKEKIELHRAPSACSACHAKMDPWGIALENYDALGGWREKALAIDPNSGKKSFPEIDPSTVLMTGEAISGPKELLEYLAFEKGDEFASSLAWHMFTYALGREPNIGDEIDLKNIEQYFRTSGYRLDALALAIVQSEAFLFSDSYQMVKREGD